MLTRNRIRINENIDTNLLEKLDILSKSIDFPKSRIIEEGIKYVLKKQREPIERNSLRKSINLTINTDLWNNLKIYSKENNYKIVHLLEEALRYSLKKFKSRIKV